MDKITILEYLGYLFVLASFGAAFITATKTTKDKESGKLTKAGKLVICFIVISFGVSFFIKMQENDLKKEASKKQKEQTDSLIAKLNNIIDSASKSNYKLSEINLKADTTVTQLKTASDNLTELNQSTSIINSNLNKTYFRQVDLLDEQTKMKLQLIRPNFKIEPIKIHYMVIISMDDLEVEKYSDRLLKDYKEYLFEQVNHKYWLRPSEELRKEGDIDRLLDNGKWLPKENGEEFNAWQTLMLNNITFNIKDNMGHEIIYRAPYGLVPFKKNLNDKSKIILYANFLKRIFIKYVISDSFTKEGNDNLSYSSIDLIGRELKWGPPLIFNINSHLDKVGFQFPYDIENENFDRFIDISRFSNKIVITPKDVGLENIVNELKRK